MRKGNRFNIRCRAVYAGVIVSDDVDQIAWNRSRCNVLNSKIADRIGSRTWTKVDGISRLIGNLYCSIGRSKHSAEIPAYAKLKNSSTGALHIDDRSA